MPAELPDPPTGNDELKDPLLRLVEESVELDLGRTERRGVGEPRDNSRRRRSPWLDMECSNESSPGGDDARRFNPAT